MLKTPTRAKVFLKPEEPRKAPKKIRTQHTMSCVFCKRLMSRWAAHYQPQSTVPCIPSHEDSLRRREESLGLRKRSKRVDSVGESA